MAELLTTQDMVDGRLDVQTLKEAVNEDKMITPRIGQEYASVPMASRLLVENGLLGATPFATYAAMTASALVNGDYAIVTNDPIKDNGVYQKINSVWVYSKLNKTSINDVLSPLPIIYDRLGVISDEIAIYLPKTVFANTNKVKKIVTVTNALSTELPQYVKISVTSNYSNELVNVSLNVDTNTYEQVTYPAVAALNSIHILSFWGANISSMTSQSIVSADTAFLDNVITNIVEPYTTTVFIDAPADVKALGFSKVAVDASNNSPYVKSKIDIKNGDYYFARVFVKTDVPDNFGAPKLFFWTASAWAGSVNLTLERKLSSTIAIYYVQARLSLDNITDVILGTNPPATGSTQMQSFGGQFASSKAYVVGVKRKSYPVVLPSATSLNDSIRFRAIPALQQPSAKYNTKVVYGQSLAAGNESWPSLSKTNKFGNLMLGDNVRPNIADGVNYPTFGASVLKPLAASVVNDAGDTLLTDEQSKTLAPGDNSTGEPINLGFVNAAKYHLNQKLMLDNDETRLFVTVNPSVAGRSIEQLSKNNTQDARYRYGRYIDAISRVHTAAASNTHVIDAIAWLQGEFNYTSAGLSWDKASYKTLFNQLINDMTSDAIAQTNQKNKPAFLTYQTSGSYTKNVDSAGKPGLHVGMAQLEVSNNRDDTFMFGPSYPYTDKNGHLDSNGYRWLGNKIAQVYKHVVLDGKNWSPLQPTKITQNGKKIIVDFYVPVPPLNFAATYVVNAATLYPAKGFKVTDTVGNITISSVTVFDTYVEIITERAAGADAHVWYASADTNGNGNLRDSDNSIAYDKYEYIASSGMYDSANIAALVNKPYPLQNWCVAFYLPVNYTYTLA